jgi:hypothetical protein
MSRVIHYGYAPNEATQQAIVLLNVMTNQQWGYTIFRKRVRAITNGRASFHHKAHPWVRNETHPVILAQMCQLALEDAQIQYRHIIVSTGDTLREKLLAETRYIPNMVPVDHYNQPRKQAEWMVEEIKTTPTPYKVWMLSDLI